MTLYAGLGLGSSLLAAGITGFLASGAAYLARVVKNLAAELDPDKLFALFEWLYSAVHTLGLPVRRLSIISTSRSTEGLRVIRVPDARRDIDPSRLEALVITAATRGEPLVQVEAGTVTIIMAGRMAFSIAEGIASYKGRRILRIATPEQLRNLYKLLRSLYQHVTGAPRALAAYLAVKAVGRLVGEGLVTFSDWSLAENALSYIPAENPLLRMKVKQQLRDETLIQP